jgi:hypothetical protein
MDGSILCWTLALAVASATAGAQGNPKPDSTAKQPTSQRVPVPPYRNRIVGVFDAQTYQPVEGAEVSDVMVGTKSVTSSTGNVSLFFLPAGASLVRIRKLGYEAQTFMVSITPQDSSPVTVVLSRVTELKPVVTIDSSRHFISEGLNGFEERKKLGIGRFVDDAQLRKDEGRQLSNEIVAHIPGAIVTIGGRLLSVREGCTPNIYLDNVLIYARGKPVPLPPGTKRQPPPTPPDFSRMQTDDYSGI